MSITKEDLQDFNRFADQKLERGEADSLVSLAGEWEAQRREMKKPLADGQPLQLDLNAESLRLLAAAFPDVQDDDKLREALARHGGITTAQMLAKAAAAAEKASSE